MMSYNVNEIKQIDKDVLKTFIGIFNSNIKMFSTDNKIKSPNDTNSFFEYWGEIINSSGDKLFRKIIKLVADKYNLHEGVLITEMDETLLYKISGIDFNTCHK
jgi:hypothetical protein